MEKRYDEVMADPAYRKFVMMRTNVVADIRAKKLGYREITIERAFSIVMKNQSLEMELSKITALTMAYLERGKEKREERKKQKTENRPTVDCVFLRSLGRYGIYSKRVVRIKRISGDAADRRRSWYPQEDQWSTDY